MFQLMQAGRLSPFYRLSFQNSENEMKFVLEVKADAGEVALASLSGLPAEVTAIASMPAFISPSQGVAGWGYGRCVVEAKSENPEWRVFEINLPHGVRVPRQYIPEIAETEMERTTISSETVMTMNCISGTLCFIFSSLYFDCESVTSEAQLSSQGFMVKDFLHAGATEGRLGMCGLAVTLDKCVTTWLSSLSPVDREKLGEEALRAMIAADSWIAGYKFDGLRGHSCHINSSGGIRMRTRGDCACLVFDGRWNPETSPVQELTPHNIDGASDQLSLLAAIAVIWKAFTQRLQVK